MLSLFGVLAALASGLLLYLASPHSLWRSGVSPRLLRAGGGLLALAALGLQIAALGVGAGLCAMLAAWMLALIGCPYLALLTAPATAATEHD